jgi:hypothetical protein
MPIGAAARAQIPRILAREYCSLIDFPLALPLNVSYVTRRAPALPFALIHRSAWNRNSANFAITEFSEVGSEVRLGASCLLWRGISRCS